MSSQAYIYREYKKRKRRTKKSAATKSSEAKESPKIAETLAQTDKSAKDGTIETCSSTKTKTRQVKKRKEERNGVQKEEKKEDKGAKEEEKKEENKEAKKEEKKEENKEAHKEEKKEENKEAKKEEKKEEKKDENKDEKKEVNKEEKKEEENKGGDMEEKKAQTNGTITDKKEEKKEEAKDEKKATDDKTIVTEEGNWSGSAIRIIKQLVGRLDLTESPDPSLPLNVAKRCITKLTDKILGPLYNKESLLEEPWIVDQNDPWCILNGKWGSKSRLVIQEFTNQLSRSIDSIPGITSAEAGEAVKKAFCTLAISITGNSAASANTVD